MHRQVPDVIGEPRETEASVALRPVCAGPTVDPLRGARGVARVARRGLRRTLALALGSALASALASLGAAATEARADEAADAAPRTTSSRARAGARIAQAIPNPAPDEDVLRPAKAPAREPDVAPIRPTKKPFESEVYWQPYWPKFRTAEYVATGAFAAMSFGSLVLAPVPDRWNRVNSFDRGARDALRIESDTGRNFARDVSDVGMALLINQLIVDSFVIAWWGHDRRSVAAQMVLIDIEAFAFTGAVNALTAALASRERPYIEKCTGPESEQPDDCTSNKRYRSFFSGHTSASFTSAGLICSHHANLNLLGGGWADAAMCSTAFAAAATVGAMRVLADQHFVTDVLTGAAVGTLSGLGLPWLLHYRYGPDAGEEAGKDRRKDRRAHRTEGPSVRLVPSGLGGALTGRF